MSDSQAQGERPGHVIIAGFGVPGRHVAELLECRGVPYGVVELNPATAARCSGNKMKIIVGDARDESVLLEAGIMHASLLVLAIPHEQAVHETIEVARRLRPDVPIFARCTYTSAGLLARQLGATESVIAEQLVAKEFYRLVNEHISSI